MTDRTCKPMDERTTTITVVPQGEPLFSEMATEVTIVDEAGGGEFVEVSQHGSTDLGKIQIDPCEWPSLRAVIDRMIFWCRQEDGE